MGAVERLEVIARDLRGEFVMDSLAGLFFDLALLADGELSVFFDLALLCLAEVGRTDFGDEALDLSFVSRFAALALSNMRPMSFESDLCVFLRPWSHCFLL